MHLLTSIPIRSVNVCTGKTPSSEREKIMKKFNKSHQVATYRLETLLSDFYPTQREISTQKRRTKAKQV